METKEITRMGMLVALAMLLSYVETLLPQFVPVPGIKLGLANTASLFALYTLSFHDALIVSLVRTSLSAVLFGNVVSLLYSVSGAVISLLVMWVVKGLFKSVILSSTLGGVTHNAVQLTLAVLVTKSKALMYYLPLLVISGIVTGYVIGLISSSLLERTDDILSPPEKEKRLQNGE